MPCSSRKWSTEILAEVRRNVIAQRSVPKPAIDRTLALMSATFEYATVEDWDEHDLEDREVLDLAVRHPPQMAQDQVTLQVTGPKPLTTRPWPLGEWLRGIRPRSLRKILWRTTVTTASLPEAVRENEEVVPVNAVSTWVLPSGVTVGR
jgi:hypothetical protein